MKLYAMLDSQGAFHEDTLLCEVHASSSGVRKRIESLARDNNPDDPPIAGTWQEITEPRSDGICMHARCGHLLGSPLPRRTPGNYRLGPDIGDGLAICTDNERCNCKLIALSCFGAAEQDSERYANARFLAASTEMEKSLCHILVLVQQGVDDRNLAAMKWHCQTALAAAYGIAAEEVTTPDLAAFVQ